MHTGSVTPPAPKATSMANDNTRPAVIVTGASAGIGRAIAERFLAAGHPLLLIARDAARLEVAAQAMRAIATGLPVHTLALDVTAADAAERIDAALARARLAAGILVNNAGIGLGGPLVDQDSGDIERLIALNITALTRLTLHFARRMRDDGGGSIINVASLGGYVPGPNQAAYYASKAYVLSLSEALAQELAATNVHVMVVAPGPVPTGIHASMGADRALYRVLLPAMSAEAIARSTYLGYRLGRRVVVPGFHNQLMAWILRVLPHRLTSPLIGKLLAPR
jgi:short-subunit dehydrogenase